jgi:hypothetical protein
MEDVMSVTYGRARFEARVESGERHGARFRALAVPPMEALRAE